MRIPMAPFPAAVVLALTATAPAELRAQDAATRRVSAAAAQIGARSRERAARWANATPVIHCGPAPLTERPGSSGELARPHIAPLEAAFLDAARAKRTLAAETRPIRVMP
jgi:hypothetical protein